MKFLSFIRMCISEMNTAMNLLELNKSSVETITFSHVFQPIISLHNETLYGYESLIRCNSVPNPELLFSLAKNQNKLFELDMFSILNSMNTFGKNSSVSPDNHQLSVNIFPSTFLESSFIYRLEKGMSQGNLLPHNITFEMNEAEDVLHVKKLKEIIKYLKSIGCKFALDDLGKGQSSLRIALELEPDIVKLDRYFCMGIHQSIRKQKFLQWITSYFKSEGVLVTLEGIEEKEELLVARQAGVDMGQGYFLGRPSSLL
ncbi:EAL domain-containing protein [Bacillus sp. BGMRC 2118]|nr:EAL domain-containing protein [Bacillus sp. BGMRC 2118]